MAGATFSGDLSLVEMDAVTDFEKDFKTDSMVQVVSATDNYLVVCPLDNASL